MQKQAAFRSGAGFTCLLWAAVAAAAPPPGPSSSPQSPEFMLYMSWPVGAGGGSSSRVPSFSLRIGQARLGNNSGNPAAGDPMRHRELFRMEVFGRQNEPALGMRLGLGGRVTYDVQRGVFGLRAEGWKRPSAFQVTTPGSNPLSFEQKHIPSPVVEIGPRKREAVRKVPPATPPAR